jgi:hypothetical protein
VPLLQPEAKVGVVQVPHGGRATGHGLKAKFWSMLAIGMSNFFGLQATPIRGEKSHCRPVRVELRTPGVACGLFSATIEPVGVIVSGNGW